MKKFCKTVQQMGIPIRLWEFVTVDGSRCLKGVIKDLPSDIPTGHCAMAVDKTIRTSAVIAWEDYDVETMNGKFYRLVGPSRLNAIIIARREVGRNFIGEAFERNFVANLF